MRSSSAPKCRYTSWPADGPRHEPAGDQTRPLERTARTRPSTPSRSPSCRGRRTRPPRRPTLRERTPSQTVGGLCLRTPRRRRSPTWTLAGGQAAFYGEPTWSVERGSRSALPLAGSWHPSEEVAMVVTCWSVKGGSGTTVVAASVAVAAARAGRAGCCSSTSPVTPSPRSDWQTRRGKDSGTGSAGRATMAGQMSSAGWSGGSTIGCRCCLGGRAPRSRRERPTRSPTCWRGSPRMVDASSSTRAPPTRIGRPVRPGSFADVPSPRPTALCWSSGAATWRCAAPLALSTCPDGVVVVTEPGRSLTPGDVESVVGAPLVAQVALDPQVARVRRRRAVDDPSGPRRRAVAP